MADKKEEHLRLAGIIKNVHSKLRRELSAKGGDFNSVWSSHVQNRELLSEYADAMSQLSQEHWAKRGETRIDWCHAVCLEYFHQGGLLRTLEKDRRRAEHQKLRLETGEWSDGVVLSSESSDLESPVSSCAPSPALPASTPRSPWPIHRSKSHEDNKQYLLSPGKGGVMASSAPQGTMMPPPQGFRAPVLRSNRIPIPSSSPHHQYRGCPSHGTALSPNPLLQISSSDSDWVHNSSLDSAGALHRRLQEGGVSPGTLGSYRSSGEGPPDATFELGGSQESQDSTADQVNSMSEGEAQREQRRLQQQYPKPLFSSVALPIKGKIRLLDVGSCNNAFSVFPEYLSFGMDICPARDGKNVFTGDILSVELSEALELAEDSADSFLRGLKSPLTHLPRNSFHVLVFSLLLEYFPAAYQRWRACYQAHELLLQNGLLLIITPDSSKQHKNQNQIKAWKKCIEAMGFTRWRYVKQDHLHCLAFRKVTPTPLSGNLNPEADPSNMYIPQDKAITDEHGWMMEEEGEATDPDTVCRNFFELPDLMEAD